MVFVLDLKLIICLCFAAFAPFSRENVFYFVLFFPLSRFL